MPCFWVHRVYSTRIFLFCIIYIIMYLLHKIMLSTLGQEQAAVVHAGITRALPPLNVPPLCYNLITVTELLFSYKRTYKCLVHDDDQRWGFIPCTHVQIYKLPCTVHVLYGYSFYSIMWCTCCTFPAFLVAQQTTKNKNGFMAAAQRLLVCRSDSVC